MENVNWNEESTKTQMSRIANYMMQGYHITPLEALNKFGSLRLAAVIFNLREKGYVIQTQKVKTENGKYVSEYWINEEDRK